MRRLLLWITARLPEPRVIYDREGQSPYLSRWYLLWQRSDQDPVLHDQHIERKAETPAPVFNLFLHQFHRSDDDGALHSHPWSWAISLVLAGGYSEERRVGQSTVLRQTVRPGRLNFLSHKTYHRVDLIEEDAWSLFLVGPKRGTWYFWDRERKARCQWRDFILARRGYEDTAPWEPDPPSCPPE
jgi:hypothetical protein